MGHAVKHITDATFDQDVLKAEGVVLVDFWAEWCGPCRLLGPVLEEVAIAMQDKVVIGKINVDESPDLASQYGIRSIPTLILFKNGTPVETKVGGLPKQSLEAWLAQNA